MLKKEAVVTTNRVSLGLKCSECIHFSKGPARFEKLCTELGVQSFSEACPEYTPDINKIVNVGDGVVLQLAAIATRLSSAQLRIFAYIFRNMDWIKKAGFEFGQTVVFSISGKDYLDQYVRGRVLFADRTGELLHITSDLETLNARSAYVSLSRPEVMTVEQFKKHRQTLVHEGHIAEPVPSTASSKRTILQCLKMSKEQYELYQSKLKNTPEEYIPPMLDVVPANWIDQRSVESILDSRKTKKGAKTNGKQVTKSGNGVFKVKRYNNAATAKRRS